MLCRFASSPQPALVRVAARGQPSGHLASGGGAVESNEGAEAAVDAGWLRRRAGLEEAEDAEKKHGGQVWWMVMKMAWRFSKLGRVRVPAAR